MNTDCHSIRSEGWIRTNNHSVNSRALCQLSYPGILEQQEAVEASTYGLEGHRSAT